MPIICFAPIGMVLDVQLNERCVLALTLQCHTLGLVETKVENERFCFLTNYRSCLWYRGWAFDV